MHAANCLENKKSDEYFYSFIPHSVSPIMSWLRRKQESSVSNFNECSLCSSSIEINVKIKHSNFKHKWFLLLCVCVFFEFNEVIIQDTDLWLSIDLHCSRFDDSNFFWWRAMTEFKRSSFFSDNFQEKDQLYCLNHKLVIMNWNQPMTEYIFFVHLQCSLNCHN